MAKLVLNIPCGLKNLCSSIGISKFVTRKIVNQNFKNLFNKM